MGEIKEQETLEEEPHHHPSSLLSKRKSDADSAAEDSDPSKKVKKSDVEIPIAAPQENHNSTVEDAQEDEGSNGNPRIDKGKAVMRDDKGKGKAKFEEEDSSRGSGGGGGGGGSSDDDSDDGVENNGDDEDSDVSDDPLAEVDLDNILPSRTRRRAAEPGAYLVNDMEDDDDDDDDVEEDAEDEDSE